MLKLLLTSRMVLMSKEFFHIFYEKSFMFLQIILCYHSQLNELMFFGFLKFFCIHLSTTPC